MKIQKPLSLSLSLSIYIYIYIYKLKFHFSCVLKINFPGLRDHLVQKKGQKGMQGHTGFFFEKEEDKAQKL